MFPDSMQSANSDDCCGSSARISDLEVHCRSPNVRLVPAQKAKPIGLNPVPPNTNEVCHGTSVVSNIEESSLTPEPYEAHPIGKRSSIDVMLDQLEAANFKLSHNSNQAAEDSLLINFDPLVSHSKEGAADQSQTNLTNTKSLTSPQTELSNDGVSGTGVISHLISPLTVQQDNEPAVAVTPGTPPSTGFTPVPSSRHAVSSPTIPLSPFVFSPWMHRSILDQALGGGDRSPEWTEPAEADPSREDQFPTISSNTRMATPNQLNFSSGSDVEAINVTTQENLSNSYASAVALPDTGDFDMLADLLGRVNVNQDDSCVLEANSKSGDVSTSKDEKEFTRCTPNRPVIMATVPGTYRIERKSDVSSSNRSETAVSSHSAAKSTENTATESFMPESCHNTINLNTTNFAPEPATNGFDAINSAEPQNHTPIQPSSRLSISSISGMVTMAARSLYDRIGGGSGLSAVSPIPKQTIPPASPSKPVAQSISSNHSHQTVATRQSSQSPESHHAQTDSRNPLVHSVDEDVWESVNSSHEVNSTAVDASVRIPAQSFQLATDENKENVHFSLTESSQSCHPSQQERLCESIVEPHSALSRLAEDSPRSISVTRNSLHETQVTPHLTASGDGPEYGKPAAKSPHLSTDQEQVSAEEWYALHDEVLHLRAIVDELKSTMNAYEKTLVDSAAAANTRNITASTRMLQIAAERDEAIDQASTMLKAYEDMYRRVQRAKETIEAKREKQQSAVKCIERYANRAKVAEEKFEKLNTYYLDRLTEALALQDRQEDEWHRKLDKMHLALRQHELRNTTLADEIHLKEQHCIELTEMSNKFFR